MGHSVHWMIFLVKKSEDLAVNTFFGVIGMNRFLTTALTVGVGIMAYNMVQNPRNMKKMQKRLMKTLR